MKDIIFSQNFHFNHFKRHKYNYTDNRAGSPYHYLAYMIKGRSKLVANDMTVEAHPGDIFYIPKGLPYQSYWYSADDIEFLSFGFLFFPESEAKQFLLQKVNCNEIVREQIKNIPTGGKTSSILLGTFYSVLSSILPDLKCTTHNCGKEIIEEAKKYIYENTNCKVSDIARHCLLSESALYHIFKKEAGLTPNELIQKIRCDKAVLLLTTTNISVQQIADTLGFSSTAYFRKVLRRHTEKTPREIRKSSEMI